MGNVRTDSVGKPSRAALVLLTGLCAAWFAMAMGPFFVGPAEWDDNLYCDMAAVPRTDASIQSRYVHIWTLRLFNGIVPSRRTAAAAYSALTVIGLMWIAYPVGRRLGGTAAGLLAAALMPLYPPLLKYLTVPYCDEPMAMWSAAALLAAMAAAHTTANRSRTIAVVACGLCCFLSAKCKETGLAVLPAVAFLLWSCDGRLKVAARWLVGILIGWLGLTLLDLIFLKQPGFSWRWSTYFPPPPPPGGSAPGAGATNRMSAEYVGILLSRTYLGFSLMGMWGLLAMFRQNRTARGLALWLFGVTAFESAVSCYFRGLHALDRYCVAIGVPLAIFSACWIVIQWRREDVRAGGTSIGLIAVLLGVLIVAGYGLVVELTEGLKSGHIRTRISFFLLPLAVVVLFVVPWLTSRRWLVRVSIVSLLAFSTIPSIGEALKYVEASHEKLKPWVELAAAMDRGNANLAIWKLPEKPFARFRVERRARSLSAKPASGIHVRVAGSLDAVKDNEWLFTDARWWQSDTPERAEMQSRGWRPFIVGGEQGQSFVVCRRNAGSSQ